MKKSIKRLIAITLSAASLAAVGMLATGCGNNFINGPTYEYKKLPSTGEYEFTGNPTTTVVPDAGIKIDGVLDEDFYKNTKWFKGNKILPTENGTLEVATYFAETGIVIAAKVHDSRPAVHSNWVETGNITCFNCYFAFGDAKQQSDGVYEIECTAGNRFKITQFTASGMKVLSPALDVAPVSAVKRDGDIKAGTCYDYAVEDFMPYALFGKQTRPEKVFLNPTMISSTLDETGNYIQQARTWYNFADRQAQELFKWGEPDSGYAFNSQGFISNKITVNATGGKIEEEWGYDWCLNLDNVNFYVKPENGKSLKSLTVNGADYTGKVANGKFTVLCRGDINISATFE